MNYYSCGGNRFSTDYYRSFLVSALENNYKFCTVRQFLESGCPETGFFVIRHDIDKEPITLSKKLSVERELGVRSTNFLRIAGADYNFMSYPIFKMLTDAELDGFEIGLHTGFFEFANLSRIDPIEVLNLEYNAISKFFNVTGLATHRDINYCFNSLPFVNENWNKIETMGFKYHAYQENIFRSTKYINEGFNPHLCWRNLSPEDVIPTGKSIYMLTHNHWWFDVHPFE